MTDLKIAFEKMGFKNVRTVLASGNIVFESELEDKNTLYKEIESSLNKVFENEIGVILRSHEELKKLQSSEPFAGIMMTPDTRLYVTFLFKKTGPRTISIPYDSPGEEFRIIQATPCEVLSVLDLSKGKGTSDLMKILEKEFGSYVTTRNWNTVLKLMS